MKLLTSETFDPTTFKKNYTLIIWSTDNKILLDKNNNDENKYYDFYGVDINDDSNHCLLEYYGVKMDKETMYSLFDENKLIYTDSDIGNVLEKCSEE